MGMKCTATKHGRLREFLTDGREMPADACHVKNADTRLQAETSLSHIFGEIARRREWLAGRTALIERAGKPVARVSPSKLGGEAELVEPEATTASNVSTKVGRTKVLARIPRCILPRG